jgi:hypothetical protein
LLDQNLKLLYNLSESNSFINNCPPDVYIPLIFIIFVSIFS